MGTFLLWCLHILYVYPDFQRPLVTLPSLCYLCPARGSTWPCNYLCQLFFSGDATVTKKVFFMFPVQQRELPRPAMGSCQPGAYLT